MRISYIPCLNILSSIFYYRILLPQLLPEQFSDKPYCHSMHNASSAPSYPAAIPFRICHNNGYPDTTHTNDMPLPQQNNLSLKRFPAGCESLPIPYFQYYRSAFCSAYRPAHQAAFLPLFLLLPLTILSADNTVHHQ